MRGYCSPYLNDIYQWTVTIKKRIRKYLQKIHYLAGEQVVLLEKGSIAIWNIRISMGYQSIIKLCWYL
jgi:hypothetical protein